LFDGSRANHSRIADLDEHRAFGCGDVVRQDIDRPHLLEGAIVAAIDHEAAILSGAMRQSGRRRSELRLYAVRCSRLYFSMSRLVTAFEIEAVIEAACENDFALP